MKWDFLLNIITKIVMFFAIIGAGTASTFCSYQPTLPDKMIQK